MAQAIGSDVAAETSRSAERNAPAKIVAVSRTEAKENMGEPFCIVFVEPDHRVRAHINAGAVPIQKNRCFSVGLLIAWQIMPANGAADW
jgi:hypothetical protein